MNTCFLHLSLWWRNVSPPELSNNDFLTCRMYRDGEIIQTLTLPPVARSLAGCASACLLDWRVDTSNGNQTVSTTIDDSNVSFTVNPVRECEAFNFNSATGVCYLLSGQTYLRLTRSDKFWSGSVICKDIQSVQDWATGVVGLSPVDPGAN